MYNLGQQFVFDYTKAVANEANVIKGENYRFTILSPRLIRLEYSKTGKFEDRPTELVWYRNMQPVTFEKQENEQILKLRTKYFELTYVKNKSFEGTKINQMANLKIDLLNTDRIWYYNHPEVRNYGAPSFSLDDNKNDFVRTKGLYSVDGFTSIDDSNSLVFTKEGVLQKRENDNKDIYLFMYLKDFALCLKDYFMITGGPSLIPRYALGNWWSRSTAYKADDIKHLINKFESKQIPLSVLLLDKSWHLGDTESGFSWQKELIPNPKELIDFIHSKNITLGLNIDPTDGFYPYEDNFKLLEQYLEKDEKGKIPFNILNPRWIDAYLKILIHPLENIGADFFWLDIDNIKNIKELNILKHYQFMDASRNLKRRPMILGRNSKIAPHRYPVLYSGKTIVGWNTLKMLPYFNECATNIGVSFWTHDIGGYYKGIEDNELYIRYIQLGTFSPIMKFGCADGKYYKREPWKWGYKTFRIASFYLNLRHRLIPYIYSECYKYYKNGMPLILPLYYSVPKIYDDMNYRNEYSFGNELFICPITTKKEYLINRVIHKFYLPDGVWYDFVTGKKFIGGKNHISFFKDEDYPVFAKSGSIITMSNDDISSIKPPTNLEIQIFPGRSNVYKLYEDDGETQLYKDGNYILTSIDYNYLPNNYTVIVRPIEGKSGIIPARRNYKFVFRNTKETNDVMAYLNDIKVEVTKYVKDNDFIVEVQNIDTIGQLTLNCKGNNIEIEASRIVNDDIESIISDLKIPTNLKEKIDIIFFSDLSNKKKRIEMRKLSSLGLEKNLINLFLQLLDYVDQIK